MSYMTLFSTDADGCSAGVPSNIAPYKIYIRLTSIYKPGIEYATFPGTAPQVFGFIEFYAGMANCSKCHRLARIPTASLDILYHKAKPGKASYMDILTTPGMAFLGPT